MSDNELPKLPPGQRWLKLAIPVPDPFEYSRDALEAVAELAADAAERALWSEASRV